MRPAAGTLNLGGISPRPGERIGLRYLGKDQDKGHHRYRLVVDRHESLDFSPFGGEEEDEA